MKPYLDLLQDVLDNGSEHDDRTGVGTIAVFGRQIRFFTSECSFPAVTTKTLAWKAVVSELLWFLEGSTSEHRLAEIKNDNKPYAELTEKERRTIWTANYENQGKALGYTDGELGRIYGSQWCSFRGVKEIKDPMYKQDGFIHGYNVYYQTVEVNQIKNIINEIKSNPNSRRLVVSAWNPVDLPTMSLPPCHYSFQFDVDGDKLSLMWNQRSVDCFLGLPFNIASYALLLHIVARMTGKKPHELIGSFGNTHIYKNHVEQVKEQLTRKPYEPPRLVLPENADYSDIDSFLKSAKTSDFKLIGYEHDGKLTAPMAV